MSILEQQHKEFESQERENDCFTQGDPWITYFENYYLGLYSAITSQLRITKRGQIVYIKTVPHKGARFTKAPYHNFIRKISGKINSAVNLGLRENAHLKQHLKEKVLRKHKAELEGLRQKKL